jgi:hypothetical protein
MVNSFDSIIRSRARIAIIVIEEVAIGLVVFLKHSRCILYS